MRRSSVVFIAMCLSACECGGGGGPDGGSGGGGGDVGAVASIELSPQVSVLEVGKRAQLVATALDASGAVLGGIPFAFTTSDSSVATVDQGLVTALKEGSALLSASANGVTSSFAVVAVVAPRPPGPPSDQLIAEALANGVIDDQTALLYRVYAVFGDGRLPLAFKGTDDEVLDSDALDVVRERWTTLTAANQRLLEPFFVPPAYLGSWTSVNHAPRALLEICKRPAVDPNWSAIPVSGGRVKVWFDNRVAGASATAQKVLTEVETKIWDAVTSPTGLGMKPPKPDGAESGCNGGDERLDIFLVDMAVYGQTSTDLGETLSNIVARKDAPTYLMLNRSLAERDLLGSAAHEFTHACQWAYPVNALGLSAYQWLKESTAQEAIDHVYPTNDLEQRHHLRAYLDAPAVSINEGPTPRSYGSYLFFQYLVRSHGAPTVGSIWAKTISLSDELKAVDQGVPGGLLAVWPLFARALWNDAPVDTQAASFAKWDTMFEKPLYVHGDGNLGGQREGTISFAPESKNASIRFAKVSFTEPETRSLLFHNTFFQAHRAQQPISVRALWKTEAGTWQEEDWSDLEWIGFCRDQKDQRLEELVLIVASAQVEGSAITSSAPPTLERNNLPCWGLEGTATRTTRDRTWTSGTSTFSVTARYGVGPVTQYYDPAEGVLRVQIAYPPFESGSGTLNEDYVSGGGCRYQANGTFQLTSAMTGGDVGSSWIINIFPQAIPAALAVQQQALIGSAPRAYQGDGASTRPVTGSISGPTPCPGPYTTSLGDFLLTQANSFELGGVPKLASDTGVFSGTLVNNESTYTWQFTARREP